jgi:hypothetical protein
MIFRKKVDFWAVVAYPQPVTPESHVQKASGPDYISNLARCLPRLFTLTRSRSLFPHSPLVQSIKLDMPTKRTQGGFYAVRTGRKTGVFKTWYVSAT